MQKHYIITSREVLMSTWRDIWRYGVIANRLYSENETEGLKAIRKMHDVYGTDGMIHYIYAEALELNGRIEPAKIEYRKAKDLFPVPHWKEVANNSIKRLKSKPVQTLESFYNIHKQTITINNKSYAVYATNFDQFLWYGFEKVYEYVHLNDFARYVCLSALSRGSSEWPLSLVDFRTVLELEIKQCFPDIISTFNETTNKYSLCNSIDLLYKLNIIDDEQKNSFHNIRIAGNIAAHNLYADEDYKKLNVANFLKVLAYFDDYRAHHTIKQNEKIEYPLCQLSISEFIDKLNEKKYF